MNSALLWVMTIYLFTVVLCTISYKLSEKYGDSLQEEISFIDTERLIFMVAFVPIFNIYLIIVFIKNIIDTQLVIRRAMRILKRETPHIYKEFMRKQKEEKRLEKLKTKQNDQTTIGS